MHPSFVRFWTLMLVLGCAAHLDAAEPQVAFTLKKGWVEFAVRREGKPVADALIQVLDERGNQFAEGETGPEGEASFPLPAGSFFTVEIKTGARTADPIRLFKTVEGVEPARVLLSYGLRPCCRSRPPYEPILCGNALEGPGDEPMWPWLAAALVGLSIAALTWYVIKFRIAPLRN